MSDTARARTIVAATYLGWTLDAFDFFILIFVLHDVAGAFVFERLADHYGRRPILIANIACFAVLEFFSGLAPTLLSFMILRTLFGVAMGGEWGIGASLAMESIPARWRGWVSGLLQSGYPSGYFLATIVFGICYPFAGWRGMFMIGGVASLAVLLFVMRIHESPDWVARQAAPRASVLTVLKNNAGLAIWAVVMMMAFNFFSHGTQDLYPSAFLSVQHHFSHDTITTIALVYNAGAIVGGIAFGSLSQRIGRRTAIITASLLALPVIPLWAFSNSPVWLAVGAFLMQVCVQGAWGVIPAHLNEISPAEIRATFPGFVYQLGNFLASFNATLQAGIGAHMGNAYSWALAGVAGAAALCITVFVGFGVEAREVRMGHTADPALARVPVRVSQK